MEIIKKPPSKSARLGGDDVTPPDKEALAAFLARRWNVSIATTRMIAVGANGNVRAAMADLEVWLG